MFRRAKDREVATRGRTYDFLDVGGKLGKEIAPGSGHPMGVKRWANRRRCAYFGIQDNALIALSMEFWASIFRSFRSGKTLSG